MNKRILIFTSFFFIFSFILILQNALANNLNKITYSYEVNDPVRDCYSINQTKVITYPDPFSNTFPGSFEAIESEISLEGSLTPEEEYNHTLDLSCLTLEISNLGDMIMNIELSENLKAGIHYLLGIQVNYNYEISEIFLSLLISGNTIGIYLTKTLFDNAYNVIRSQTETTYINNVDLASNFKVNVLSISMISFTKNPGLEQINSLPLRAIAGTYNSLDNDHTNFDIIEDSMRVNVVGNIFSFPNSLIFIFLIVVLCIVLLFYFKKNKQMKMKKKMKKSSKTNLRSRK